MFAAERQAMIVEMIRRNGSVQVDALARELGVSSMTIRRDLVKLKEEDKIERCHGGAVENAAVTLSAPVLLAFNAINNLFGIGTSSMMSRALGRKEYDTVRRASSFGFYCTVFLSFLFSMIYLAARNPLLALLGTDADTLGATAEYMKWTVAYGAMPAILNVVMAYMVRSEGSTVHASIGTMSGCVLNIVLDPIFILPQGLNMGAAGAGFATFLSNCAACLYFFGLLYVRRGKT